VADAQADPAGGQRCQKAVAGVVFALRPEKEVRERSVLCAGPGRWCDELGSHNITGTREL
jgi:hypothetical protein